MDRLFLSGSLAAIGAIGAVGFGGIAYGALLRKGGAAYLKSEIGKKIAESMTGLMSNIDMKSIAQTAASTSKNIDMKELASIASQIVMNTK